MTAPPRRGSPEWQRRAEAWAAAHGLPASLWLGPALDPLPEPDMPRAAPAVAAGAVSQDARSPPPGRTRKASTGHF